MNPSNDNRTKIYRIRRKEDGKFLTCRPDPYPTRTHWWDPVGAFWRKPETIKKHLMQLCRPTYYCGTPKISGGVIIYPWGTPYKSLPVVHSWLDRYEVVATDITVHGEQTMEARDFASLLTDERLWA